MHSGRRRRWVAWIIVAVAVGLLVMLVIGVSVL